MTSPEKAPGILSEEGPDGEPSEEEVAQRFSNYDEEGQGSIACGQLGGGQPLCPPASSACTHPPSTPATPLNASITDPADIAVSVPWQRSCRTCACRSTRTSSARQLRSWTATKLVPSPLESSCCGGGADRVAPGTCHGNMPLLVSRWSACSCKQKTASHQRPAPAPLCASKPKRIAGGSMCRCRRGNEKHCMCEHTSPSRQRSNVDG